MAIYDRLARACREHKRINAGKLPVRFELHPEHLADLRADGRIVELTWSCNPDLKEFMGVPIEINLSAIEPVMVTSWGMRIEV